MDHNPANSAGKKASAFFRNALKKASAIVATGGAVVVLLLVLVLVGTYTVTSVNKFRSEIATTQSAYEKAIAKINGLSALTTDKLVSVVQSERGMPEIKAVPALPKRWYFFQEKFEAIQYDPSMSFGVAVTNWGDTYRATRLEGGSWKKVEKPTSTSTHVAVTN